MWSTPRWSKNSRGGIKEFVKNAIGNILHANIDVHSRILVSEFLGDGVKFIAKLQSHCANMSFANKSRHERIFQQVKHKGGESAMNYIIRFQNWKGFLSFSLKKNTQRINSCTCFWINFTKVENILLKYLATRRS